MQVQAQGLRQERLCQCKASGHLPGWQQQGPTPSLRQVSHLPSVLLLLQTLLHGAFFAAGVLHLAYVFASTDLLHAEANMHSVPRIDSASASRCFGEGSMPSRDMLKPI